MERVGGEVLSHWARITVKIRLIFTRGRGVAGLELFGSNTDVNI